MIPIGRDTILARFPWMTGLLMAVTLLVFLFTWPREMSFLSNRRPDSPLVVEAKALAALALDGVSTLPADLRVRLEDLRADAHFPDQTADGIIESVEKHFEYLNTFKRPDWDRHYAAYADARQALERDNVPWRSVLSPYVFRSDDSFGWPLGTYFWIHTGILHLLLCLYFLWLAGSHMEETWGSLVTFLTYVGGALAAATAVHFAMPGGEWTLLGGTAAVSALMGGLMVRAFTKPVRFFYMLGVTYGVFTLPAWTALPVWAVAAAHIGWFTDGRLDGLPAALFHGTGFVWGMAIGGLTGLGRGREESSSGSDTPFLLTRRVEQAAELFKAGRIEQARDLCQGVLEADPAHLGAMKQMMAIHESFQDEDSAARIAVRIIRTSLEKGLGQLAEETFRKWSLRLFQAKIPPQERLALAQNLETLQLWREALAYYRSVIEGTPGTSFAGKAIFSSAKIHQNQLRKSEDAAKLLRELLDPPYDVEWRALAEVELRTIMNMKM